MIRAFFQVMTSRAIIVPSTARMQSDAGQKASKPSCKGVKAALQIRLRIKTIKTETGSFFLKTLIIVNTKAIPMRMYKTLQTGPKRHVGGAKKGFSIVA